jgi:hypothetical protein
MGQALAKEKQVEWIKRLSFVRIVIWSVPLQGREHQFAELS